MSAAAARIIRELDLAPPATEILRRAIDGDPGVNPLTFASTLARELSISAPAALAILNRAMGNEGTADVAGALAREMSLASPATAPLADLALAYNDTFPWATYDNPDNPDPNVASWFGSCWSAELGLFVLSGASPDGCIATSPDGKVWTVRPSAVNGGLTSVAWSPQLGLFVSTYVGNFVYTSTDGENWVRRDHNIAGDFRYVIWAEGLGGGAGMFVLVQTHNDGIWTPGGNALLSEDGENWTRYEMPREADMFLQGVCWSKELGVLVAFGDAAQGADLVASRDGKNWTVIETRPYLTDDDPSPQTYGGVVWAKELGCFVGINDWGLGIPSAISRDGYAWEDAPFDARFSYVAHPNDQYNGGRIVWAPEMGLFAATVIDSTGGGPKIITSVDGLSWPKLPERAGSDMFDIAGPFAWSPQLGVLVFPAAFDVFGGGPKTKGVALSNPLVQADGATYYDSVSDFERLGFANAPAAATGLIGSWWFKGHQPLWTVPFMTTDNSTDGDTICAWPLIFFDIFDNGDDPPTYVAEFGMQPSGPFASQPYVFAHSLPLTVDVGDDKFHHGLISMNCVTGEMKLYVDGQKMALDPLPVGFPPSRGTPFTVDVREVGQWTMGSQNTIHDGDFNNRQFYYQEPGCTAQVFAQFFENGALPDIDDPEVIAKFRTAAGDPAYLGPRGQAPFGSIPLIFMPDGDGKNNLGSGGSMTATGSPVACGDKP